MKNKKGFTLIELLIVIAIIGILATIVLISLSGARKKAVAAQVKAHIIQISNALEQAKLDGCQNIIIQSGQTLEGTIEDNGCSSDAVYIQNVPSTPIIGKTYNACNPGSSPHCFGDLVSEQNINLLQSVEVSVVFSPWPVEVFYCQSGSCYCSTGASGCNSI